VLVAAREELVTGFGEREMHPVVVGCPSEHLSVSHQLPLRCLALSLSELSDALEAAIPKTSAAALRPWRFIALLRLRCLIVESLRTLRNVAPRRHGEPPPPASVFRFQPLGLRRCALTRHRTVAEASQTGARRSGSGPHFGPMRHLCILSDRGGVWATLRSRPMPRSVSGLRIRFVDSFDDDVKAWAHFQAAQRLAEPR
jgi:hypothetical protein